MEEDCRIFNVDLENVINSCLVIDKSLIQESLITSQQYPRLCQGLKYEQASPKFQKSSAWGTENLTEVFVLFFPACFVG